MVGAILLTFAFSIDPLESLSLLPDTLALPTILDVGATAMLLTFLPVSDVLATVRPLEGTMAVLLIIHILANVLAAVRPSESTVAFHLVIDPLTIVDPAISPDVLANTMNVVLVELAIVCALV